MNFGQALEYLKGGRKVRRAGWNGKGMHIELMKGSFDGEFWGFDGGQHPDPGHRSTLNGVSLSLFRNELANHDTIMPCLGMRAADKSFVPGWLASQTDMLAEDWEIAE